MSSTFTIVSCLLSLVIPLFSLRQSRPNSKSGLICSCVAVLVSLGGKAPLLLGLNQAQSLCCGSRQTAATELVCKRERVVGFGLVVAGEQRKALRYINKWKSLRSVRTGMIVIGVMFFEVSPVEFSSLIPLNPRELGTFLPCRSLGSCRRTRYRTLYEHWEFFPVGIYLHRY